MTQPKVHLIDMAEQERKVIDSMTVLAHTCVAHVDDKAVVIICSCKAQWKLSRKEWDAGVDHIEDHRRYAQRTETRPD